jgi:pimeloyl-ACP methyl ester carboxylesterase
MPYAIINGNSMYYEVHGNGEPLILIQGFTGGSDAWGLQVRAFKKHFQTIVFDNRGAGRSELPKEPLTIEMMAADVTGLMDHLGIEHANILGLSMGGMIAQETSISYPGRVKKLILCSTFATRDLPGTNDTPSEKSTTGTGGHKPDIRELDFDTLMTNVISLAYNNPLYRTLFLSLMKLNKKSIDSKGVFSQAEALSTHSTTDRLHLIKSSTLVMTGTADRLVSPLHSDILAEHIPGAKLVKIEGGSHAFFFEMPGKFNKEVLDFLIAR